MKKIILFSLAVLALASCRKPNPGGESDGKLKDVSGVYVFSEGAYKGNNAQLTYMDVKNDTHFEDYFKLKNGRAIGSTGCDMFLYGSKIYASLQTSGTVEVIDAASGISLKQIEAKNDKGVSREPRQFAASGSNVFVPCFDGKVLVIDTLSLSVTKLLQAGENPDGAAVCSGKLFVSNSAGLSYVSFGTTISVFDLGDLDKAPQTLTLPSPHVNPTKMVADTSEGYVYLQTNGDYYEVAPALHKIDAEGIKFTATYPVPLSGFCISDKKAYIINYDYSKSEGSVSVLNLKTDTIVNKFITDETSVKWPYGISVDEKTGDVYISDAVDYTMPSGDVYCFSAEGKKLSNFKAGIYPSKIILLR